jgi:hypothetical protein
LAALALENLQSGVCGIRSFSAAIGGLPADRRGFPGEIAAASKDATDVESPIGASLKWNHFGCSTFTLREIPKA